MIAISSKGDLKDVAKPLRSEKLFYVAARSRESKIDGEAFRSIPIS
jgi:hypothetical protein